MGDGKDQLCRGEREHSTRYGASKVPCGSSVDGARSRGHGKPFRFSPEAGGEPWRVINRDP